MCNHVPYIHIPWGTLTTQYPMKNTVGELHEINWKSFRYVVTLCTRIWIKASLPEQFVPQLTSHTVLHHNVQLNYVPLILICAVPNLSFDERCTCWQPQLDADFPLVKNLLSVKLDHTHNHSHKLASLIDLAKVFFMTNSCIRIPCDICWPDWLGN